MRSGMSIIELIVSISVLGIVISSAPLLVRQASSSTALSVVRQEIILQAKTQALRAMLRDWDANSYDADTKKSYIINTNTQHTQLKDRNGITGFSARRSKHPRIGTNAVLENAFVTASAINTATAIEQFHNLCTNLKSNGTNIKMGLQDAKESDYATRQVTNVVTVRYMDDRLQIGGVDVDFNLQTINNLVLNPQSFRTIAPPHNQSSNIKIITATINANEDFDGDGANEQAVLHGFACNIGESSPSIIRLYAP